MVQLLDTDIRTRDVLEWHGVHLLHAQISSCSQKLRIYLNWKGIPWQSHVIDVAAKAQNDEWFMGINPRGLVPVLVHDGVVHIESNDILLHLEAAFPDPALVPQSHRDDIATLLRHEDDLHMDLRTVTMSFLLPPSQPPKSEAELAAYANAGSGTVLGKPDPAKLREIAFYRQFLEGGITDEAKRAAVARFTVEFRRLDDLLEQQAFLLGEHFSVLDIAWLIYAHRLVECGYPLERLHPRLGRWYSRLASDPRVRDEIAMPVELAKHVASLREQAVARNETLEAVCQLPASSIAGDRAC